MGEIIEGTRRHYVGADADKDTIPAGGKAFGDSYHANDKGKQYYWNGTAWKTGLGHEFVNRRTDTFDFRETGTKAVFNTDGTYKIDGLDLSGIVPVGAVAVLLAVEATDDAAASAFQVRTNATDPFNRISVDVQVANIPVRRVEPIAIDADLLLDYTGTNVAFFRIDVTVLGWWI